MQDCLGPFADVPFVARCFLSGKTCKRERFASMAGDEGPERVTFFTLGTHQSPMARPSAASMARLPRACFAICNSMAQAMVLRTSRQSILSPIVPHARSNSASTERVGKVSRPLCARMCENVRAVRYLRALYECTELALYEASLRLSRPGEIQKILFKVFPTASICGISVPCSWVFAKSTFEEAYEHIFPSRSRSSDPPCSVRNPVKS